MYKQIACCLDTWRWLGTTVPVTVPTLTTEAVRIIAHWQPLQEILPMKLGKMLFLHLKDQKWVGQWNSYTDETCLAPWSDVLHNVSAGTLRPRWSSRLSKEQSRGSFQIIARITDMLLHCISVQKIHINTSYMEDEDQGKSSAQAKVWSSNSIASQ